MFNNVNDGEEQDEFLTNPINPDTDGDGLNDGEELELRTNPLIPDTDGDGVLDGEDAFTTSVMIIFQNRQRWFG